MAHAKMLRESLESLPEGMVEDPLYQGLREGVYDDYLSAERGEWVDKHLSMLKTARDKSLKKGKQSLKEFLFPKKFRESN